MSDDFKPLDPGRVMTADALEVKYWSNELGCTEAQLKAVVQQVGEHVTAIRAALEASRQRG